MNKKAGVYKKVSTDKTSVRKKAPSVVVPEQK